MVDTYCTKCNSHYLCGPQTMRIHGPVVKTKCPLCGSEDVENFSAFLVGQTGNSGKFRKAVSMIKLGRIISGVLNERKK
jgi:uncharacterized protein YbbK (DUF523 family)